MAVGTDVGVGTSEFVAVAVLSDLREAGRRLVVLDGRPLGLFYHGGQVYAVDNACPRLGYPLTRGTVRDGTLTCFYSGSRRQLTTVVVG